MSKNNQSSPKKKLVAFKELLKAYISKLALKIFNTKKPIEIETYTSDLVIKVYFSQKFKSK